MITLAINTSSQPELVALFQDGQILGKKQWRGNMDETKKLLMNIANLLKRVRKKWSDVKKIVVACGPGGFTGLRIGVTVANTLAIILKIPIFEMASGKSVKIAIPKYDLPPNITKPRHV